MRKNMPRKAKRPQISIFMPGKLDGSWSNSIDLVQFSLDVHQTLLNMSQFLHELRFIHLVLRHILIDDVGKSRPNCPFSLTRRTNERFFFFEDIMVESKTGGMQPVHAPVTLNHDSVRMHVPLANTIQRLI
jgi:hypothetical protein